jgi:hypothetical protein
VARILGAAQAGFDEGKASLHEHDEEARDERPHEVDGDLVLPDLIDDVRERQALLGIADRNVGDVAGNRAPWIAFRLVLCFRPGEALDIGVGDWSRGRGGRSGGRQQALGSRPDSAVRGLAPVPSPAPHTTQLQGRATPFSSSCPRCCRAGDHSFLPMVTSSSRRRLSCTPG